MISAFSFFLRVLVFFTTVTFIVFCLIIPTLSFSFPIIIFSLFTRSTVSVFPFLAFTFPKVTFFSSSFLLLPLFSSLNTTKVFSLVILVLFAFVTFPT